MKKRLVFATNNAHKLEEIRAILGNSIEILSLADIHCHADIPETADTLEGNARQKSRYVYEHYGLDCFADDTGLEVESLGGAPGVYSARYADGQGHDSQANMNKLLKEMEEKNDRKAQFRTIISLIEKGEERQFEGIVRDKLPEKKEENPDSATILSFNPTVMKPHSPNWVATSRTASATAHVQ